MFSYVETYYKLMPSISQYPQIEIKSFSSSGMLHLGILLDGSKKLLARAGVYLLKLHIHSMLFTCCSSPGAKGRGKDESGEAAAQNIR